MFTFGDALVLRITFGGDHRVLSARAGLLLRRLRHMPHRRPIALRADQQSSLEGHGGGEEKSA